jgi:RNA polymerase sigma factor (sigma-70 family)
MMGALQGVRQGIDMTTGLNKVLDHLRRTLAPPDGGPTDGQLLARFIASRDEVSFATLVRRHGPMVWRLCLRILGHVQNAEDAFQATFLVLACKAATVLKRESVGSFLYGVAYRTALKARTIHARRRSRERQVAEMPHPEIPPVEPQDWLDHELNLLPGKYRAVMVACDLEGRSRKEAARQLGLSEGTVSSRLSRGRHLLAKRLSRYGLSLSGGVLASALAEGAHVPASLLSSTTETAVLVATGQAATVSGSVEVLMKGALKMMFLAKLKVAVGAVVVVTALGAAGLAYQGTEEEPRRARNQYAPPAAGRVEGRPQAEARRPQVEELEALRLEIEALRKSLQATRERVKALEDEVGALKGERRTLPGARAPGARPGQIMPPGAPALPPARPAPPAGSRPTRPAPTPSSTSPRRPDTTADPLSDAQEALKKLRQNPDDKQAAEALERALKWLKEREKPRMPGETRR